MSYNYGTVGLATIVSGSAQLIAADSSVPNCAVRVFDVVLISTAASVSLYAGTSSAAANLVMIIDKNNVDIRSNAGMRFNGGVYQSTSATAGNLATISYIKEF